MPRAKKGSLTVAELQEMLAAAAKEIKTLERDRAAHQKAIGAIDAQLATLRGTARRGRPAKVKVVKKKAAVKKAKKVKRRKLPRQAKPLREVVAQVLSASAKPMGPKAVAEAVRKTGYKSTSKNFVTVVNVALSKDPSIARVGKGQYTLKSKG